MPIGHFEPREPSHSRESLTHATANSWGIHPLNCVVLVALDFMLFSGELGSGGLFVAVSLVVGAALILPCTLVQRYAYRDSWGLAIGKGLLMSLLTAIPTPLPSAVTIALGAAGSIALRHRGDRSNVIDIEN